MLTSLILTWGASRTPTSSLLNRLPAPAAEPAPAPSAEPPAAQAPEGTAPEAGGDAPADAPAPTE